MTKADFEDNFRSFGFCICLYNDQEHNNDTYSIYTKIIYKVSTDYDIISKNLIYDIITVYL